MKDLKIWLIFMWVIILICLGILLWQVEKSNQEVISQLGWINERLDTIVQWNEYIVWVVNGEPRCYFDDNTWYWWTNIPCPKDLINNK